MVERYFGSVVPQGRDDGLHAASAADYDAYHGALDGSAGYLLHDALKSVWRTIARANEFVDRQAPWKLAKDPALAQELERTLAALIREVALQAVHLAPFMPERSEEVWRQLGAPGSVHEQRFASLDALDPSGWRVAKGEPLFPKQK
jgi:methionyl-tRNA synthetase